MMTLFSRTGRMTMAICSALACSIGQAQSFDGYALYNTNNSTTAYLIGAAGNIAHTWSCPTSYSYAMALKPNGNIVRTAVASGNQINVAAGSGRVQELNPQGQVVWDFSYTSANYVTHHDMCLMPNGNVLLLAYVKQTVAELQALGYTGTAAKYPSRIIEIQPSGSTAQIVWTWEMKDRFIQYTDASKPNYLPIAQYPERMNINVAVSSMGGGQGGGVDWFHENGIDYNADLDQIVLSARHLSEIFIIDHSTTTLEAAGHTGGNGGRGGDFLFRWGKPANYGVAGTQRIPAAVHDVKWVKGGAMNGWISFFNNNGGGSNTSTVDAIDPVRDGYNYPWTAGTVWGPANYDWRHTCLAYSSGQSAAEIMPNGNVFCAVSGEYMYEVGGSGQVVWQYNASPQKAFRYTCDHPGVIALLGDNPCGLTTGVGTLADADLSIFPNPSNGVFTLNGLNAEEVDHIAVVDATGREVLRTRNAQRIDLGDRAEGFYSIRVTMTSGKPLVRKVAVQR